MSKRLSACIMVVILLLSTAVIIFQTSRKDGYHIDEIYTFALSNYEDGFDFLLSEEDTNPPKWSNREDLYRFLTVSDETRFDYKSVIENQKADVHPPLYYIIFHTVSSFMTNSYSKYAGVGINLIFTIGTCILLYLIGNTIFKRRTLSLIAVALFAFSPNCINMATYLRMYAMLVFFCVWLMYLNIRLFEKSYTFSKQDCILLTLCVLLGSLTHYYFLIFAVSVFATVACILYKRVCKDNRRSVYVGYIIPFLTAGVIYIILWPTVFAHLFGTSRGDEAFGNFFSVSFFENVKDNLEVLYIGLGRGVSVVFVIATLMGISNTKKKYIPMMALSGFIYFLVVTQIAPYQTDRYISPLFPILIILGVYYADKAAKILWIKAIRKYRVSSAVIFVLAMATVFSVEISHNFKTLEASDSGKNYLYLKSEQCKKFLDENKGKKCLVVYDDWQDILPCFNEYENFSETAFVSQEKLDEFLKTDAFKIEREMVIYINNQLDIDKIFKKIEDETGFHTYGDLLHEHYRHWSFACLLQK